MTTPVAEGRGCNHCETGTPMAFFQRAGGGIVRLCIDCLMEWFPGRSVEWLEERLDYFMDHIDYRLAVANHKKGFGKTPVRSTFVAPVPPLKRTSQ